MCRTSVEPAAPSSWTGISRGAISTTWVSRPSWTSALAASRPSSPPPMTTPLVAVGAGGPDRLEVLDGAVDEAAVLAAALDRRDERRRTGGEHQHVVLVDGDGAGVAAEEVVRTARDGGDTTVTVRAARSISVTTLSSTSRTRGSSYSPPGRSDSASRSPRGRTSW